MRSVIHYVWIVENSMLGWTYHLTPRLIRWVLNHACFAFRTQQRGVFSLYHTLELRWSHMHTQPSVQPLTKVSKLVVPPASREAKPASITKLAIRGSSPLSLYSFITDLNLIVPIVNLWVIDVTYIPRLTVDVNVHRCHVRKSTPLRNAEAAGTDMKGCKYSQVAALSPFADQSLTALSKPPVKN